MSNDEFDTWLSLVGRLLGLSERQRTQIGAELRDHLESRVADLLESGMDKKSAVLQAVEEFGDAAVLAKNLQSVSLENRKRWMMRFMTLATAAMFLVAVLTMAMWPENARFGSPSDTVAQEDPINSGGDPDDLFAPSSVAQAESTATPSARSMSNMQIRETLNDSIDLAYDETPFGDIRRQLSQDLQLNIVVDSGLEGVLDSDSLISSNLKGVRISDGLRMILKNHDATYAIKGGVLLVISIDDESEPHYLARHMVDVREMLRIIKLSEADRIGKPLASIRTGGGGGFIGGGQGGGGVFCIAPQGVLMDEASDKTPTQIVIQKEVMTAEHLLVETITRVVSPDAWADSGGNCDLTCIGGVLVVLSHESLAEEVQDFVTDLEYQMKNRKD